MGKKEKVRHKVIQFPQLIRARPDADHENIVTHTHTHTHCSGWSTPPSAPWAFRGLRSAWPSHTFPPTPCLLVNHQENPPGFSMVASSRYIAEDEPPAVVVGAHSIQPMV
jgi:hypothetical protein